MRLNMLIAQRLHILLLMIVFQPKYYLWSLVRNTAEGLADDAKILFLFQGFRGNSTDLPGFWAISLLQELFADTRQKIRSKSSTATQPKINKF